MADIIKTTNVKAAVMTESVKTAPEVKPAAVQTTEKTAEVKEEPKTEAKAPAKKETKTAAKKPAGRKAAAAKKAAEKKAAAEEKAAAKKVTAKTVKQVINLQFAGKSYSMEDLQRIANDVWKYDLHKSDEAYTSLELYVKPEESVAYYVFNGDITGSFFI